MGKMWMMLLSWSMLNTTVFAFKDASYKYWLWCLSVLTGFNVQSGSTSEVDLIKASSIHTTWSTRTQTQQWPTEPKPHLEIHYFNIKDFRSILKKLKAHNFPKKPLIIKRYLF